MLAAVFAKMTIAPNSLPKNFKISGQGITFDIDIILTNPTRADFSVSTYVATLKRILVYYKGELLGVAAVEISEIEVPNYNSLILKNVNISIPYGTVLLNQEQLRLEFANMTLFNHLSFSGVVEAMGTEYQIG